MLHYRGSKDGDVCVVSVKKMEVCHWSKRLHLGYPVSSLDFCPSERYVLFDLHNFFQGMESIIGIGIGICHKTELHNEGIFVF